MDLIAKSTVTIAIVILLIVIDPKLAFIVGLSLSIVYVLIIILLINILKKLVKTIKK